MDMLNSFAKSASGEETSNTGGEGTSPTGGEEADAMAGLMAKATKLMSPESMAAVQKAIANPKIKEAATDCYKNGFGAASKYSSDPEIMKVLDDLKKLF